MRKIVLLVLALAGWSGCRFCTYEDCKEACGELGVAMYSPSRDECICNHGSCGGGK